MKKFEHVPIIQSELGHLSKMEMRRYVLEYYKKNLKGKTVVNKDTGITIHFSMTSGRKTAMGEAMYQKKAEMVRILPNLVNMPSTTTLESVRLMKVTTSLDT